MLSLGTDAQNRTVLTSSEKFANPMLDGQVYRFTTTVDCRVKIGATGDSVTNDATTSGQVLVLAGQVVLLHGEASDESLNYVHVRRIGSTDGEANLARFE